MRRLVFILALACCITAFGQAFTPLRPFIFAQPSTGGDGFLYPTNISGLSNWWVWTDMPTNNIRITNWVDRINSRVWYATNTDAIYMITNTYSGVHFVQNPTLSYNKLDGAVTITPVCTTWIQMSREQTTLYGYFLIGGFLGNSFYWYWHDGFNWCYQTDTSVNENRYVDPPIGEVFDNTLVLSNSTARFYTNGVLSFYTNFINGSPTEWIRMGITPSENFSEVFGGHVLQMAVWPDVAVSESDLLLLHQYQEYTQPINITVQPASVACLTNSVISLSITALGAKGYQWRTNSVNIANGSHWGGVNTNVLWITNDSTLFTNLSIDCVVTNLYFAQTSSVAYLTVMTDAVTNGLVGWWRFDEGSGTSTADATGLGNAGNLTNSPGWVTGKYTNGIYFPYAATAGAASFVRVTNAASLNTFSAISLAGWVYITNAAADVGSIIIKKTTADVAAAPADPYALYEMKISTTQLYGGVSTGGAGTRRSATLVTTTSQNTWHHCVMTYDGANLKLYKDTVILTNYNAGSIAIGSNVFPVSLGASVYSGAVQPLVGLGDDFRIYNRALNTNEINALYQWTGPQQ